MEIYCKKCDKVLGHYPDEKIPLNVKGHTTCNLCGSRIELFRTAEDALTKNIVEAHKPSIDDLNGIDEIVQTIPLLSGRKDRGVKKADLISLGMGLLIFFAILFVYKPDFDPSKIFPENLKTKLAVEMMKNMQGGENELPQNFPDMEGLEEIEKVEEAVEKMLRKQNTRQVINQVFR